MPRGVNGIPFLITKEDGVDEALKKLIAKTKLPNDKKIQKILKELDQTKMEAAKAALTVMKVLKQEDDLTEQAIGDILGLAEVVDQGESNDLAAMKQMLTQKEEEIENLKKELAQKAGSPDDGEKVGDVFKEYIRKDGTLDEDLIPKDIRPMVTALWTKNTANDERITKISKELEEEREVRVQKEYDEKAGEYGNIKVEGLGTIMKEVGTKCPDQYEKFVSVLKVANDGLGASGSDFGEIGSNGKGVVGSNNPDALYGQIQERAVTICKEEGLTKSEMVAQFVTKNPEGRKMYAEYVKGHRART